MKSLTQTNRHPSLFESLFSDFDRAFAPQSQKQHSPAVEVNRGDDAYTVRAVLPGVAKEDLNVKVENGYLHISGKTSWQAAEGQQQVYSEIHRYEEFQRALRLDERSFAVDRVEAKLENGVLDVTLPIREESKPKNIQVQVN